MAKSFSEWDGVANAFALFSTFPEAKYVQNTRLLKIQVHCRQKLQKEQIKHGYKVYSREWRE